MRMIAKWVAVSACPLALNATASTLLAGADAPIVSSVASAAVQDRDLDSLLSREAQRVMRTLSPLEGQRISANVRATMDIGTGVITVFFTRDFLPMEAEAEFEDQLDNFRHAMVEASAPFMDATAVKYLFDRRDIFFHFPKLEREDAEARKANSLKRTASGAGSGMAMVSAGHGYYRRLVKDIWTTQREQTNGVLEDLITPSYAEDLKFWMESRSQMPVHRPRSGSEAMHPSSKQPWWQMAGRYSLESQYPENPEIWNSLGAGSSDNHHYREDIRSRPLLANHQNADVAVHLHTNAADASATGTRVIYQTGREQDRLLASNILCYMREIIRSVEAYEQFPVSQTPQADNKGENRLATMPSVIVEAAFHTNPDDARALQDPVFRTASMKGVEKGYRLWREGKGCKPLALQRATDVTLPPYSAGNVEVHFEGHPQFPVKMKIDPIGCPPGFTCTGGEAEVTDAQDSPLTFTMKCGRTTQTIVTQWQTVLRDDDGVASAPAMHRLTCTGPGSADKRTTTSQATGIGMF